MDGTPEERLEVGSDDINMCGDPSILSYVRQWAYWHGTGYL